MALGFHGAADPRSPEDCDQPGMRARGLQRRVDDLDGLANEE